MSNYKEQCISALKAFIQESSNENKMELYLAFDELETESEQEKLLGTALYQIMIRILKENNHPDEYLASLKELY